MAGEQSPIVWRSLDELAGFAREEEISSVEFLARVESSLTGPSRRDFLKVSAASLALAGVSGCAYQPAESIVPYVQAPEEIIPGRPLFFASAVPIDGFASGVLVKSEMGRPIKIEGNPAHPASLGATDLFGQAALLGLYDPDRSGLITRGGRIESWEHFQTLMLDTRESSVRSKKGLRTKNPDADRSLADSGRSDSSSARTVSRSQVARVRERIARRNSRGHAVGIRRGARAGASF